MINKKVCFSSVKSITEILILLLGLQTKCVANTCWLQPMHAVGSWQSFSGLFRHLNTTTYVMPPYMYLSPW